MALQLCCYCSWRIISHFWYAVFYVSG